MSRIKIQLPDTFLFTTNIPVRITDINYGGHIGNDSILSLLHEARMQFLAQWNFTEMNMAGIGMIMADVGIEFKNEAFYGEVLIASVTAANLTKVSFDIFYKLQKQEGNQLKTVAIAKTGMVCYDYTKKKIAVLPEAAARAFKQT